jgi:hypothetical protein
MTITSRSYNHATHKYEDWGVKDNGDVYVEPVQLELPLDDCEWREYTERYRILKPPRLADECECPSCSQ